jgi:hypothetical protein
VLNLGHFESRSKAHGKFFKCGAEEGWRSVGSDHMKHEKVLRRVKEERNILYTIKRNVGWTCHILRRNCLVEHVIAGKM